MAYSSGHAGNACLSGGLPGDLRVRLLRPVPVPDSDGAVDDLGRCAASGRRVGAAPIAQGRVGTTGLTMGTAGTQQKRAFWPALFALVLAGAGVRTVYTLLEAPWPPPTLDDQFYFSALPKLVADGHGWVRPLAFLFDETSLPTADHPPLHSLLLAGWAELAGTSPDAQRLTGTVFGAGTISTIGVLGRRLAGNRAGLMAAGLAALYPVLIAADGALMSESLFGLLVALLLLTAYRLVDAPTIGRAFALGAVAGLAALTRGEALLLLP